MRVGQRNFTPPSTGFHHAESDSARSRDMGRRSSKSSLFIKHNVKGKAEDVLTCWQCSHKGIDRLVG